MIIKTLSDVQKEGMVKEAATDTGSWESRRYLLRKDGMGFSFHNTIVYKGSTMRYNYANHLEAVFIVKGTGWIEVVKHKDDKPGTGQRHALSPGTMYALNGHEPHWIHADEDLHKVCVFTPPCAGPETHDVDGVYPYIGDDGVMDYNFWSEKQKKKEKIIIELKDETSKS